MKRRILCLSILAAWTTLNLLAQGQQQTDHLEILDKPRLVDCKDQPCFRIAFNAVDIAGLLAPLVLDEKASNTEVEVIEGGVRSHPVFYVKTTGAEDRSARQRYSMLLIDTSGSMLTPVTQGGMTRFDAARDAALHTLDNFRDGLDHLAVVPFDSHNVAARIRQAVFADTAAQVRQQIAALEPPAKNNNTALYSAIYEALGVLTPYKERDNDVSLMLLTDGKNDVDPPPEDDLGLLQAEDFPIVKAKTEVAAVPIVTIGFGAKGAFDEAALRSLAWPSVANYYFAQDYERLAKIFGGVRLKLISRWEVSFGPVRDDKNQLTGQTLVFKVVVTTPSGMKLESRNEPSWVSPAIGSPSYESSLTPAELDRFIASPATVRGSNPFLTRLFWRLVIMIGLGGLIAFLWLGLPRTLWPELYVKVPPILAKAGPGRANRFAAAAPAPPRPPAWQQAGMPGREEARRSSGRGAAPPASPSPFPSGRPTRPTAPTDQTVFQPQDDNDPEDR